jgi:hypothetical protein
MGQVVANAVDTLPVSYLFGGPVDGIEENDIFHETYFGARDTWKLFEREKLEHRFRFSGGALSTFRTLHERTRGRERPFVYWPDLASAEVYYVRKDQPGFAPAELNQPSEPPTWEYSILISEESPGGDIEE